jgi:hypothetical protein
VTGDIVLLRVLSDLVACGSLFQIGLYRVTMLSKDMHRKEGNPKSTQKREIIVRNVIQRLSPAQTVSRPAPYSLKRE